MLLSCRILGDVANVNSFDCVAAAEFNDGDSPSVFFQLIDLAKDQGLQGWKPAGRRYMPAAAATLQVTFDSIDTSKQLVRQAIQPFVQDPSIWKVDILPTDAGKLRGTVAIRLLLTEGSIVTNGSLRGALRIGVSNSNCSC